MTACKDRQSPEDRLQSGEHIVLTFASNPASKGLQQLAGIDKNPVPHSKIPALTRAVRCLLSSRSMVRIHQGAYLVKTRLRDVELTSEVHEWRVAEGDGEGY